MKKAYLELGQIVGTHGIKGELRVNPWCDSPDFAKAFRTVFFDEKGENAVRVEACRTHGNLILMKLQNVNTVDEAASLRNRVLYIRRDDASLPEGSWFISELLDCTVYDADCPEKIYGTLTDVIPTGANDVWQITAPDGKAYLIPAIRDVVIETDVDAGRILIRPLKGIFDDAD